MDYIEPQIFSAARLLLNNYKKNKKIIVSVVVIITTKTAKFWCRGWGLTRV